MDAQPMLRAAFNALAEHQQMQAEAASTSPCPEVSYASTMQNCTVNGELLPSGLGQRKEGRKKKKREGEESREWGERLGRKFLSLARG